MDIRSEFWTSSKYKDIGCPERSFLTGLVAWRIKTPLTHVVLAIAWLSHGLYDYYHTHHNFLFVNAGVFCWYPAFCAVVDLAVGTYLLASYKQLGHPSKNEPNAHTKP